MKKEKFITVMALLDDRTQQLLQQVQNGLEQQYGTDTKTKDIPYHITLGSYPVEQTDEVVSQIIAVAERSENFPVKLNGLGHFGNTVRYIDPEINEELKELHMHFDSDYANGYSEWVPHITVYRHSEPAEIELSEQITEKLGQLKEAVIVGIELGEFFPAKKIIRVLF